MQTEKYQPIERQESAQPKTARKLKIHQKKTGKMATASSDRLSIRHVAVLGYN